MLLFLRCTCFTSVDSVDSTGININNKLSTLVDAEKQKFIIKFFTFLLEPFFNENQTLFSTLCNLKQSSWIFFPMIFEMSSYHEFKTRSKIYFSMPTLLSFIKKIIFFCVLNQVTKNTFQLHRVTFLANKTRIYYRTPWAGGLRELQKY